MVYTLPRAIKEEKKSEEGVGHSGVEKEKKEKTREEFGNKGGESLCLDREGSRELERRGFEEVWSRFVRREGKCEKERRVRRAFFPFPGSCFGEPMYLCLFLKGSRKNIKLC